MASKDILHSHKKAMLEYEKGPLMGYAPYTHHTFKTPLFDGRLEVINTCNHAWFFFFW